MCNSSSNYLEVINITGRKFQNIKSITKSIIGNEKDGVLMNYGDIFLKEHLILFIIGLFFLIKPSNIITIVKFYAKYSQWLGKKYWSGILKETGQEKFILMGRVIGFILIIIYLVQTFLIYLRMN